MYSESYLSLHISLLSQELVVLDEICVQGPRAAALRLVDETRALDGRTTAERHLTCHCQAKMDFICRKINTFA